jgi:predicted HicB family RNase H-like nuclease
MANLRSSKGERITREMIESISAEAEAGYDPRTFRPRRVGRPPLGKGASPRVNFRVPQTLLKQAMAKAKREGSSLSAVGRRLLEEYVRGRSQARR